MSDCYIVFTFRDQYGDFQIERLRASQAGSCYQVESIPQFTPSVSRGDIVSAVMEEDELHFEMVMDASGNSTIQVYFFDETQMESVFEYITARGCNWEAHPEKKLLAVNVPDSVQYSPLQLYFEKGEEEGKWTFKESCLSHY
ncbi:DUF4265 domain-containing protein [Pseudobacter ginsenosidimutans]|uniref:Uncharacterized protein DUF4265 n=1 Tax=Pseudobacter ginsenosidimutans TaxID=661488 RepID=A0A4Q7MTK1_9BACT|nr:DUF4265 domain-containing protein [Pseudobacter ginsenosidimutans]RZS71947.1 uncharacterized protein DUF4265 [Pseudobacter ginsenosidimutans]